MRLAETVRVAEHGPPPRGPSGFRSRSAPVPCASAPGAQSSSEVAPGTSPRGSARRSDPGTAGTAGTWVGTCGIADGKAKAASPLPVPGIPFPFLLGTPPLPAFLPWRFWGLWLLRPRTPRAETRGPPADPVLSAGVGGGLHAAARPVRAPSFCRSCSEPRVFVGSPSAFAQPASPPGECMGILSTSHNQILEGRRSSGSTLPCQARLPSQPLGPGLRPDPEPCIGSPRIVYSAAHEAKAAGLGVSCILTEAGTPRKVRVGDEGSRPQRQKVDRDGTLERHWVKNTGVIGSLHFYCKQANSCMR